MFSRRAGWSLETNEYAQLTGRKKQSGAVLLDLTESNPTRAALNYPPGILAALADPHALVYEPDAWGLPSARSAAAEQHGVDPAQVMITASTSESYSYLFKLLCNPGDKVLVPRPSYPLFEFLARLENVDVAQYSLRYAGKKWSIDLDSLVRQITPRTRAILLVNPNNPTGNYVHPEEIQQLADICGRHALALVSDEVFHEYPLGGSVCTNWQPVAEQSLVFRLQGLSKMAGLPQMKAGWMILGGPEELRREAGQRLELIADTYLSVSAPVQHALPALLRQGALVRGEILQRVQSNLRWLEGVADPLHVEGGWYAILPLPAHMEEYALALRLLQDDNVLVQPGFFYDFEQDGFLVLSLLPKPEIFQEGVQRLINRIRDERATSTPSFRALPTGQ